MTIKNKKLPEGEVIWITGLSGAGKSCLANEIVFRLRDLRRDVVFLDGDELREVFGKSTVNVNNHEREIRLALALQYSKLCQILANQGLIVVIATISLFKEIHAWNRANLPGYFEIYLNVPIEELRRRDPKGIYQGFYAGNLKDVAGLDLKIDEPEMVDWHVHFQPNKSVEDLAEDFFKLRGAIKNKN